MFDLPQIVIPAMLYNVVLCSLFTAMSWHAVSAVQAVVRRRNDR